MSPATVLLISPGIIRWTDLDFGLPHLVALGGWLRERLGVRVEILDLNYEGGDHAQLARTIDAMGPLLVVGIAAYTSFDLLRVHALATFLKERYPDITLVAGGYHASALPYDLVFQGSPFDAVVVGEGELPFEQIVAARLGGNALEKTVWGPDRIEDLDTLPPYAWDLLDRYWGRCNELGRKLQIYLSRGCPYHCTFCMERSKSGYSWRSFSPERALSELDRLAARTDLSEWVVNVADPLFGFHRRWRREVLEGILRRGIRPRQFWTLTRTDDLDEDDVRLLAEARFSIGIGMESGSPTMLKLMQKGNEPHRYLDNLRRLATLSRVHGLSWAANVIVGHPGETHETMRETHAFVKELFLSARETCGWVSIDPFRIYPGAAVHDQMAQWSANTGAVFHHPKWWWSWYDGPFRAQHIEPSHTLSYEDRVRFMIDSYGPVVAEVQARFRGQGRSVDRVFARSLAEQRNLLSPAQRDALIAQGRKAKRELARDGGPPAPAAPVTPLVRAREVRPGLRAPAAPAIPGPPPEVLRLRVPIGMHIKDPALRRREEAVRRLLDAGVLRTATIIEALLQVGPERFMSDAEAEALLYDRKPHVDHEGQLPVGLGLRYLALGLEALSPGPGDVAIDATARSGWVTAVLAELVGPEGQAIAHHPGADPHALRAALADWPQATVIARPQRHLLRFEQPADVIWIGAALPRVPRSVARALRAPDGRAVAPIGPRFRPQDLTVISPGEPIPAERSLGRVIAPVFAGEGGWLPSPAAPAPAVTGASADPTPTRPSSPAHSVAWSAPAGGAANAGAQRHAAASPNADAHSNGIARAHGLTDAATHAHANAATHARAGAQDHGLADAATHARANAATHARANAATHARANADTHGHADAQDHGLTDAATHAHANAAPHAHADAHSAGSATAPPVTYNGARSAQEPAPGLITLHAWPAPALAFGLLASVDLGRDAANHYAASVGPAPWSAPIAAAWADAPGRLSLLALLLRHAELDPLLEALRRPQGALDDAAGRRLCDAFADALEGQRRPFERGWSQTAQLRADRLARASAWIPTWTRWRAHLYAARGAPPPLRILDVPALGKRARATTLPGTVRVVAADLGQPAEHAQLQVFHEEVHPVTDPIVHAEHGGNALRDTRVDQPGWSLHREIERVAVGATWALLQRHDPSWLPALDAWRA